MRSARRAAFSQWSSCPGFGIPTWQRLWSVFLSQTWNGFKSRAAALNLQRANLHLHTHRIDGALTPDVALSPPQVSLRGVHRRCWQLKNGKRSWAERATALSDCASRVADLRRSLRTPYEKGELLSELSGDKTHEEFQFAIEISLLVVVRMWSLRGCSPWVTFPATGSFGMSGWIKLAAITAGSGVNR